MDVGSVENSMSAVITTSLFDALSDDLVRFLIEKYYKSLVCDVRRDCAEVVSHGWSRQHTTELFRPDLVQTCRRLMSLFRPLIQRNIVQSGPAFLRAQIAVFIARLVDKTHVYCMDRPLNSRMCYWLVVHGLGGLGLLVKRLRVVPKLAPENLRLQFYWCTYDSRFAGHQLTLRAPSGFVKEPAARTAAQAAELRVWVEEEVLKFVRGGAAMFWHLQRQELVGYNQRGMMAFM